MKSIPSTVLAVLVAALAVPADQARSQSAPAATQPVATLGAADWKPSPDHPFGWRGDGNGRYAAANPPTTWGRVSVAVKELGVQATKPAGTDKGKPITDGVIREWLVVGPVVVPEGKQHKDEFGTNEADFAPTDGDKLGELQWKAVTTDGCWLRFTKLFEKPADHKTVVAYAHTWIYSTEGKPVAVNIQFAGPGKVWLNGKDVGFIQRSGMRLQLPLAKGWNRMLVRAAPNPDTNWSKGVVQWYLSASLFGTEKDPFDSKGIAWSTPLPDNGPGVGSPALADQRLFVPAESNALVCIRAKDGKVLWARSSTYADAATAEERAKNPGVFAEIDQLRAGIDESLKTYCADPAKYQADSETVKKRLANERKINQLMKGLDAERYVGQSSCEAGESAPTPATDGQHVYALYGSGVVSCFDLEGNRKWTTVLNLKHNEHGYCASPCLAEGKLVIKTTSPQGAVALDCKTGNIDTQTPLWKKRLSAYSSPLAVNVGGQKLIVQSFGVINRLSDGKVLSNASALPGSNDYVSPVTEGALVCSWIRPKPSDDGPRFLFQTLPDTIADPLVMKDTKEITYDAKAFPCWFDYAHCASPLMHEGLAYVLSIDGVLTVIDAAKGEVAYQKLLDLAPMMSHNGAVRSGCSSSPTLAGKHIYIFGNQGTCLVIEPGRQFKQVARNRIEQIFLLRRNECMATNPIFSGRRMYMRTETRLYCVEEP